MLSQNVPQKCTRLSSTKEKQSYVVKAIFHTAKTLPSLPPMEMQRSDAFEARADGSLGSSRTAAIFDP
jgi:hypothetical protein